jgi:hypothetical protein
VVIPADSQLIFALSSMLAYLSRTDIAIKQIEKLSWDWIKMDCSGGKCYGLLAVSTRLIAAYLRSIGSVSLLRSSTWSFRRCSSG